MTARPLTGQAGPEIFVAIDFETAEYRSDSACSIGIVRVEDGQVTAREHFLIRPPRRYFVHSHIHGITWDHVATAPTFGELWSTIAPLLEGAHFLAAHNAGFDRKVLLSCCEVYGLAPPATPFVCTVQLARKQWNLRPTRLPNVCEFLGIELRHHDALSDAHACARIVLAARGEPVAAPAERTTARMDAGLVQGEVAT